MQNLHMPGDVIVDPDKIDRDPPQVMFRPPV
jgi:hypothetical protein